MVSRRITTQAIAILSSSLGIAISITACKPEFTERPSEVENYRILAIQSEPAEWLSVLDPDTNLAKPATYRALVTNPLGAVDNADLDWAFCTLPKPLTELNDVSVVCFQNDPRYTVEVGKGPQASAPVPENACRQFGPDVPEDQSYRPADPDVTGGYYQPLRILYTPVPNQLIPALGKVRIRCGLPGASQEQVSKYNRSYHLNTNPVIEAVAANGLPLKSVEADANAEPLTLPPNQTVTLHVSWPICPVVDACGDGYCGPTETKETGEGQCEADCKVENACGGAERYLAFHLDSRLLVEDREIMRVSWFAAANGGSFRDDRSGRDANDQATFAENNFTAPSAPGVYPLWVVLRDSRGGVTWNTFRVRVE